MKRALFQWFNLLMACIVLLSSTGFGLVDHSCQMRGKKRTIIVAFSDTKPQKGCAADKQPAPPTDQPVIKKTVCCQDDQKYENVDISSSLSQLVAKFVKTVTETVLAGASLAVTWLVEWVFNKESSALAVDVFSPSLSGRDIITLVRSLLI
jgi:hypothetical protein